MIIDSKNKSFELYQTGLFGNKLRSWDSVQEYKESGHVGTVTVRYKGNSSSPFCKYNIKSSDADSVIKSIISSGAKEELIVLNESAPDEKLLIQGELTKDSGGYSLFYSCEQGKMRDCMKFGIQIYGLSAKLLLMKYMNANSYADVMELIDSYPDHVIEFSTYDQCLGSCHGRNTIIWEVRKY